MIRLKLEDDVLAMRVAGSFFDPSVGAIAERWPFYVGVDCNERKARTPHRCEIASATGFLARRRRILKEPTPCRPSTGRFRAGHGSLRSDFCNSNVTMVSGNTSPSLLVSLCSLPDAT